MFARQRKIAKIEDRYNDVRSYKQLWQEYKLIRNKQQQQQVVAAAAVTENDASDSQAVAADVNGDSQQQQQQESSITDVEPVERKIIEYDLVDDDNHNDTASCDGTASSSRGSVRSWGRKRRRRNRRKKQNDDSSSQEQPEEQQQQQHCRSSSFDLKDTGTWYFDFQEGFDPPAAVQGGTAWK